MKQLTAKQTDIINSSVLERKLIALLEERNSDLLKMRVNIEKEYKNKIKRVNKNIRENNNKIHILNNDVNISFKDAVLQTIKKSFGYKLFTNKDLRTQLVCEYQNEIHLTIKVSRALNELKSCGIISKVKGTRGRNVVWSLRKRNEK